MVSCRFSLKPILGEMFVCFLFSFVFAQHGFLGSVQASDTCFSVQSFCHWQQCEPPGTHHAQEIEHLHAKVSRTAQEPRETGGSGVSFLRLGDSLSPCNNQTKGIQRNTHVIEDQLQGSLDDMCIYIYIYICIQVYLYIQAYILIVYRTCVYIYIFTYHATIYLHCYIVIMHVMHFQVFSDQVLFPVPIPGQARWEKPNREVLIYQSNKSKQLPVFKV